MKKASSKKLFSKLENDALVVNDSFKKELRTVVTGVESSENQAFSAILILFKRPRVLGGTLAALALVAVGVSVLGGSEEPRTIARHDILKATLELPTDLSDVLTINEIRAIAQTELPSGEFIAEIELTNKDGTLVYKVTFTDGSHQMYNATTGEALLNPKKETELEPEEPAEVTSGITLLEAQSIALGVYPDKSIKSIELTTYNDISVYKVRFSDGSYVKVDANTGEVVKKNDEGNKKHRKHDDDDDDHHEWENDEDDSSRWRDWRDRDYDWDDNWGDWRR